jgi:hypothetical protein
VTTAPQCYDPNDGCIADYYEPYPGYYDDDVEPFHPALPPLEGRAAKPTWIELLNQDEVWYDKTGEAIPLSRVDDRYATNICNWLLDRAEPIKLSVDLWYCFVPGPNGDMAMMAFDAEMTQVWETKAEDYIRDSKLFEALWAKVNG